MFFDWAKKHGLIRQDRPTAADTLVKVREPIRTPEIFTFEEMTAIMKAAEPEMIAYLAVAGFAGVRSAEIEKLDWSAINFETGYIRSFLLPINTALAGNASFSMEWKHPGPWEAVK